MMVQLDYQQEKKPLFSVEPKMINVNKRNKIYDTQQKTNILQNKTKRSQSVSQSFKICVCVFLQSFLTCTTGILAKHRNNRSMCADFLQI